MDRDDMNKLKFDTRLTGRRGWLAPGELEAELDSLPDVASKIASEEEMAEESAPAEPAPPTDAPPTDTPAAPGMGFPS